MTEETFLLPLSYAQRRMWFLDQLIPNSATYNIHQAIPLNFRLNIQALEKSLREIVKRHETLRTTFTSIDGEPRQRVVSHVGKVLEIIDVEGTPGTAEQNAEVLELARKEAAMPFDLEQGPLARFTLLRLGPSNQVLLITLHHIISDGWSMQVLSQDLNALYTAFTMGRPSPLPELTIQYADFALWQQDWLQGGTLKQQLDYWSTQLKDISLLDLPTDYPRPPILSYQGSQYPLNIPPPLTQKLEQLAHQQNVTLFMLLLTAFKTLLLRYANQTDIVVGVPTAGRNRTELEGLIGFFVNVLVMRSDLSGDPSFSEALSRVRNVVLGAFAHEELPFEIIVENLQPERDPGRNPLFQVSFQLLNLQNLTTSDNPDDSPLQIQRGTSSFDMAVNLWATRNGIQGHIEYSTDLFKKETIAQMVKNYEVLLHSITNNPDATLSTLPLLTPGQRNQLLVEWNDTQQPYPRDSKVHILFEEQVENNPDAIALICGDRKLSYSELNKLADERSTQLATSGVKPSTLVALYSPRSVEMIINMLAILKSGAAYAHIDPDYPEERICMLLNDLNPVQIVGENIPQKFQSMVKSSANWTSDLSMDSPAYVMYTSGSTGTPKGVIVPHKAIIRLVKNTSFIHFSTHDVFLQFAAPSFDASTFEIWGPLLNGGSLVIPEITGKISIHDLCNMIKKHAITTLWLTSGLFDQIVESCLDSLHSVRYLLTGGDIVTPASAIKALETLSNCQLINGYGPTEGTTFSTCFPVTDVAEIQTGVPIGRPITNTSVYILDSHLEPVPVGVLGEIYIGGDGLASGYLNSPELTAQRFITDPFSRHQDSKLYRTGDLGRYRHDGSIEFHGRIDQQIKINGFRIEPNEISTILQHHPEIREAIVISHQNKPDDKKLTAYIVTKNNTTLSNTEIRKFLKKRLPAFMIPSAYVILDDLPLTENGKIDKSALPDYQYERTDFKNKLIKPSTETELILADIWKDLLNIEELGIHDDFFNECGGHSLLATQLLSRILNELGVALSLQQFFEQPSIAGLTDMILETKLQQINETELESILDELEGST